MITPLGSLGTANDKSGGTTQLDMAVTRTVPVGNLLVAWVGWDSVFSIFANTEAEESYQLHDTQDNVWTLVAVVTDRQDFFASGGWAGIFVTQVDNQLTTADTITVLGEPSFIGTLIAKAISVEEFEIELPNGDPCRWVQAPGSGPGYAGAAVYNSTLNTGDPPPLAVDYTLGAIPIDREWLMLHGIASEGPDTDVYTWDPAWTEITGTGTTGGADNTNIALRGGYQVVQGHLASVDVTNTSSGSRDNSQIMIGLAFTKVTEFPTTPLRDDFNRADEYPMDGGVWETVHVGGQPGEAYGSAFGTLESNEMRGTGGSAFNEDWGPCHEAYVTITDFAGGPEIHVGYMGNTADATAEGHGVAWGTVSLGQPIIFGRSMITGGVDRGKEFVWPPTATDGVKWGLQRTCEGRLAVTRLWLNYGPGWYEVAAIALRTEGLGQRAALAIDSNTGRQDDFGGGEIECDCGRFIPQVMRY